jgi:hypothetical protein
MASAFDPRRLILDAARANLIARFASRGVIDIRFVTAFPDLPGAGVWHCTTTDNERDALQRDDRLVDLTLTELRVVGFSAIDLASSVVIVQSQQTVDRDYEGSWFYALR